MTPEAALLRAIHCLDRVHEQGFKVKAFLRALETVRSTDPAELELRADEESLTDLEGIGDSTARLITEALAGDYPSYLEKIEAETPVPITDAGAQYRAALRGDCHTHSRWSDGGYEIEQMAATAIDLGHEYMVLTDHSGRLTIAHGLDEQRLARAVSLLPRPLRGARAACAGARVPAWSSHSRASIWDMKRRR